MGGTNGIDPDTGQARTDGDVHLHIEVRRSRTVPQWGSADTIDPRVFYEPGLYTAWGPQRTQGF